MHSREWCRTGAGLDSAYPVNVSGKRGRNIWFRCPARSSWTTGRNRAQLRVSRIRRFFVHDRANFTSKWWQHCEWLRARPAYAFGRLTCSLENMTTEKQRAAAKRNIKKAAKTARRKRTIARLPKKTRTALGREAAKAARKKRSKSK